MQRGTYTTTFDESVPLAGQSAPTCPECDGRVQMTTHETVCEACGLVLAAEQVDHGPESRDFDDDDTDTTTKRTGPQRTPARHDRGLSTTIGYGKTDPTDDRLSARKRRQLGRLRREQSRTVRQTTRERSQAYGLTEIRRVTSALGLDTSLRDQACRLFQSAQAADLLLGRSVEAMSAAAVYAAGRCDARPITRQQVSDRATVASDRVATAYTVLNRELGLPTPPREPARFLPRLVSALDVAPAVGRAARRLLAAANEQLAASGAHPVGIAGGALLLAANDHGDHRGFTQQELAAVADVSIVTLRTRRDALRRYQ